MGKKTPSASSESVTTMSSAPPDVNESLDNSIVSEADTTASTDVANGGKGAKKPGLMKRMSLRREKKKEEKKEKELEKEKVKEMEKEKMKEKAKEKENEKQKDKEKEKTKDKKKDKDKKQEKDKVNERDKQKEDGQKKTAESIYTKISTDDFEAKQLEFKLWMLEQQNGSVDALKPSKVKSYFKKFVKEWNKKRLPQRYYWSSEETPPPSRAGSRFSFAEEVQTPDFLNFPAAPVDLSNDDLDSLDESSIERSGSFSTFGKTQKPEGLNDEITPTMPKRPLLSAVFPMADMTSNENSAKVSPTVSKMMAQPLVICEDMTDSDPPTPTPESSFTDGPALSAQSPVLLTYDQSPGLANGALKERYAITPDNNNTKMTENIENVSYEVQTSSYTCMENDVLPGEELKVTEILERAIQEDLLPSGELTPIAEEESVAATKRVRPQAVVEALQPVLQRNNNNANTEEQMQSKTQETVDSSWEVVDAKTETGQVTFRGLPPPPKEWKMDPMGLTHTVLPTRPLSQEKTITSTEVVTLPPEVIEDTKTTKVIKTTTITTVEHVTQEGKAVEEDSATKFVTSPVIKSPVIAVHDNQVLPSPLERKSVTVEKQIRHPVVPEQPVISLEREKVESPTVVSPVMLSLERQEPKSLANPAVTVVGLENLEIKQSNRNENPVVPSPAESSVTLVSQELKSPTMPVEKPAILVQQFVTVKRTSTPSHVEIKRRSIPEAVTAEQPVAGHIEVKRTSQPETITVEKQAASASHIEIKRTSQPINEPIFVSQATDETKTVTIQPKSVSIPATSHVTLAHQEVHSPVSKPIAVVENKTSTMNVKETDAHYRTKTGSEMYVLSQESSQHISAPADVPRQSVHAYSPPYSVTSHAVERIPVQHTETTHVIKTTEVSSPAVIYGEPSPGASHIPRPVPKVQPPPPLYLNTSVTTTAVSPTKHTSQVISHSPRSPTQEETSYVQMRTVKTSVSPRQSAEMKHPVTPDSAEKKKVPTLSPIIVNASTIPMLFQEAMKPVELGSSPPGKSPKSPKSPTSSAPAKPPRSPEKPKPAPRPSSLRSPTSPTSPGSLIPVAVKAEPISPVRSPNRERVPPPKARRPENFTSSTNLVMVSSPPPSQTTSQTNMVPPVSPNNVTASKIPPPKAPRPAKSPVSPPPPSAIHLNVHTAAQPNITVQHEVVTKTLQPEAIVFTSDVTSTSATQSTAVTVSQSQNVAITTQTASPGPMPTESPGQPSYSKFMYEQPSFLAGRTTDARRSMSRINFTPPKPSPKPRLTTSYIETSPSPPKETVMSTSYSGLPTVTEQNTIPAPDQYFQKTEKTTTVSFTQPTPVNVENTRRTNVTSQTVSPQQTDEDFNELLVRPEQTRKTFGPTFLRLAGDRRSLSRAEGAKVQQMQNTRENSEQPPAPVEMERPNPFQGHTTVYSSSSSSVPMRPQRSEPQPYRQPPAPIEREGPNQFRGHTTVYTSSTSSVPVYPQRSEPQTYRQPPAPIEREGPNQFRGHTTVYTSSTSSVPVHSRSSDPQPFRQSPSNVERENPNQFQGQTTFYSSAGPVPVQNLGPDASNVVNKYLMEIKESTQAISFTGEVTEEKKGRPLSQGDEGGVQMRPTVMSNVEPQNPPRETTHTVYEVKNTRGPLYGTSAYKEHESVSFSRPGHGAVGRQYASLPRNNRGVSMGAVVVEMGPPPHPAATQKGMTQSRSSYAGYPVGNDFQTPGDRRSFAGYAGGQDLETPQDRSSFAGHAPVPHAVSPSYVLSGYHAQKHLSMPRSRSSYAGSSTTYSTSSLTPEEMARFQEVLRQKSHARPANVR